MWQDVPRTMGCDMYLLALLDCCFRPGAGRARTIALALLFNYRMFAELRESLLQQRGRVELAAAADANTPTPSSP